MSNKSSVKGKYLCRVFRVPAEILYGDKTCRYDEMILYKQRKSALKRRKQERQNKRKARRK